MLSDGESDTMPGAARAKKWGHLFTKFGVSGQSGECRWNKRSRTSIQATGATFRSRILSSESTRECSASTPELKNMEYSNRQYMSKIFQFSLKKIGMSATDATFSMEAYETNVLILGMLMTSSMKAAIHLGPNCLANLEIYKNTQNSTILRVYSTFLKSW